MDIQALLGWLLIFNTGLYIVSLLFMILVPKWSYRISHYFVDVDEAGYHMLCAQFLAMYELLIIFFLLMPDLVFWLDLI